jgi:hypothetical protein
LDLQGNIENFTLVDIFQLVATGRKSGTLGIQRDESIVMVYFEAGDVIYAYGPRETFHLGELLTERGRITSEQLEQAIQTQDKSQNAKRLGEILIDLGYLGRVDLEAVVREQVEELLFSLLAWRTGSFKFYEGQFPTREEITVKLSVENVILEGIRRLDEQNLIGDTIPNLDGVYSIASSASGRTRAVTLKASEWNVMALVDGHLSVKEICEISPFDRHQTLNRLAQLRLAGLIEPSGRTNTAEAPNSVLEQRVGRLSRLLENYLAEKTPGATVDRGVTRIVTGETLGESN